MPASTPIPEAWFSLPPQTLVVGDGPYARALALILDAAALDSERLLAAPVSSEAGSYPLVLDSLERVLLVAGLSQSAADLLRVHDALWHWVEKLSREGDQHELVILFVVPPAGVALGQALAAGLGLEQFVEETPGHGLARMDDPLADLLAKAAAIVPQDLPPLRARRTADLRHAALRALLDAPQGGVAAAAQAVKVAFANQEYLLDLFCRPPSHRHGNQLRGWLNAVVTGQVTPNDQGGPIGRPSDWLEDSRLN